MTATGLTADHLLANYRRIATAVTARRLGQQVSRDADDDVVLACALASRADLIVSGDNDLLELKTFGAIPIVSIARAIKGFNSKL